MRHMLATSSALDRLLRAVGDPIGDLRGIGPGHPEFHSAQVIRAGAAVLAKRPESFSAITRAIQIDDGAPVSAQTRAHLAAAEAWLARNPILAAESYTFILHRWPCDLLALRLAQSCYFFLGWHERLCALIDSVIPAWKSDDRAFDFVRAMASFAHAENGDAGYAEALGREALARDPACPLGVHAVAHAIAESGRPAAGAQWMRDQHAHWACESRMRTHNAWHLATFDAEADHVESALEVLDAWLLPAARESALDACDATALLRLLTSKGVPDAGRWNEISNAFAQTVTPGFWSYVDLHAALAHRAAGNAAHVADLVRTVERCARGTDYAALRARHVTLPGVRALDAWAGARYGEAAALLADLRPVLGSAGGSRVQLELFEQLEHEAVRRHQAQADTPVRRPARVHASSTGSTERNNDRRRNPSSSAESRGLLRIA